MPVNKERNGRQEVEESGSPWRPEDPLWMKDRREEWNKVKVRLTGATFYLGREHWQKLKEYFFFGTPLARRPAQHEIEFCLWWLHPTGLDMDALKFSNQCSMNSIRSSFLNFYGALKSVIIEEGDAVYGTMGGREQTIMRAINPGFNWREKVYLCPNGGSACLLPYYMFNKCLVSTANELINHKSYFAFAPGHVLWNHLSFAMSIDPREIYLPYPLSRNENCEKQIDWSSSSIRKQVQESKARVDRLSDGALSSVITFFDRPDRDSSRQRATTVQHVEYLLGHYERKEFSDALLARFDAAKRCIKRSKSSYNIAWVADAKSRPYCCCRLRLSNKRHLELVSRMLSLNDDTPLFQADVEDSLKDAFLELENIRAAHKVEASSSGEVLTLSWDRIGMKEAIDAVNKLIAVGVDGLCVLIIEEKNKTSKIFVHDNDGSRELTTWKRRQLGKITRRTNIPRLLEDIELSLNGK